MRFTCSCSYVYLRTLAYLSAGPHVEIPEGYMRLACRVGNSKGEIQAILRACRMYVYVIVMSKRFAYIIYMKGHR